MFDKLFDEELKNGTFMTNSEKEVFLNDLM